MDDDDKNIEEKLHEVEIVAPETKETADPSPAAAVVEPHSQSNTHLNENVSVADKVLPSPTQLELTNVEDSPNEKAAASKAADNGIELDEMVSGQLTEMEYLISEYESDDIDKEECRDEHIGSVNYSYLSIFDPFDDVVELRTDSHLLKVSKLMKIEESNIDDSTEKNRFSVVSLESVETIESYPYDEAKPEKADFFEKLGKVPDVKDISLTNSATEIKHVAPTQGRFVDPLTGDSLHENILETKTEDYVSIEMEVLEGEEEQETEISDFEFDDFDTIYPEELDKKIVETTEKEDEDLLDFFVAEQFPIETQELETVPLNDEEEKLKNLMLTEVQQFLDELIGSIVFSFNEIESTVILRRSFNKLRLFKKLAELLNETYTEKYVEIFLNRKASNFFRRRGLLRYVHSDSGVAMVPEKEKFDDALENLDRAMGRETAVQIKIKQRIASLTEKESEVKAMESEEKRQMEELVKSTIKRESMPRLEQIVENELGKMRTLAEEISEVRTVLISRQHTLGSLTAQIAETESLGDGLRVADYEAIDRETRALGKKIEEKDFDLHKFYVRFNSTIHFMAHSKIHSEISMNRHKLQMYTLKELEDERYKCRQDIFEAKKKRFRILRQVTELSQSCGLLGHPTLLKDFDDTYDHVRQKREMVENMRDTLKNLDQKLRRLTVSNNKN